jgi:hypothetical protein
MAFGITGYLAIQPILDAFGTRGLFLGLSGLAVLALVPLAGRGIELRRSAAYGPVPGHGQSARTLLILASLGILYVANSAMWTYLDRIGDASHLPPGTVSLGLSVSMVTGLIGASLAAMFAPKSRSWLAIGAGMLLMTASTASLWLSQFGAVYVCAVAGFNGTLMFVVPFYLASLSGGPSASRDLGSATMTIFVGLAAGPLLGSQLVRDGTYSRLIGATVIAFLVAMALDALAELRRPGSVLSVR